MSAQEQLKYRDEPNTASNKDAVIS